MDCIRREDVMDIENIFGKIKSVDEAMDYINDKTVLMYGGFGGVGTSPLLINEIVKKNVKELTLIGNDAGFPQIGIGKVVCNRQAKKMITTHIGSNPIAGELMTSGEMEVEFSPQGTFAERVRAGGSGLGGILINVGLGTVIEEGKQVLNLDDNPYLLEKPLTAEVGIIYAKAADPFGNLIYDKTARNFNPLVAMAADITIVHAEKIVPLGELNQEEIVTPGVYVDIIVTGKGGEWKWVWE
jgi:acetate CoA/acetoacetate CoA-transferase alpha subunit